MVGKTSSYAVLAAFFCMACALAAAGRVRADEAFVCGPDTIIYVKSEEIELRKQTDACVAAHFGLTVETKAAPARQEPADLAEVHRTKLTVKPVANAKAAATAVRPAAEVNSASTTTQLSARPQPAAASEGINYRRVRVINATSASTAWFIHTR